MSKPAHSLDIPSDPRVRRAWIAFKLQEAGSSFRALAAKLGCTPQALSMVAGGATAARLEAELAAAIGLTDRQLFPEHFDKSGRRLLRTSFLKRKGLASTFNVKSAGAA